MRSEFEFHQHPDGIVYVGPDYVAPIRDFLADCATLGLDPPNVGNTERLYVRGVKHHVWSDRESAVQGALEDAVIDSILARRAELVAVMRDREARAAPPPSPSPAWLDDVVKRRREGKPYTAEDVERLLDRYALRGRLS